MKVSRSKTGNGQIKLQWVAVVKVDEVKYLGSAIQITDRALKKKRVQKDSSG